MQKILGAYQTMIASMLSFMMIRDDPPDPCSQQICLFRSGTRMGRIGRIVTDFQKQALQHDHAIPISGAAARIFFDGLEKSRPLSRRERQHVVVHWNVARRHDILAAHVKSSRHFMSFCP